MIFSPEFCEAVQAGTKTVTRRPANGRECPHRVGSIQKVQPGQGQPALPGRIQITSIRLESLKELTKSDARRSGFGSRNPRRELLQWWGDRYGGKSSQPVYRIEFHYIPRD